MSHAQITEQVVIEYNAALDAEDPALIKQASIALGEAAIKGAEHPEAGLFAYEAAWALCRTGFCEEAKAISDFAATRQDAPSTAGVLKAYIDWRIDQTISNHWELNSQLQRIERETPVRLTVSAFRDVYSNSVSRQNWSPAAEQAKRAEEHFKLGGEALLQFQMEARMVHLTSSFNASPKVQHLREMIHLEGEMSRLRNLSETKPPKWMDDIYWNAAAWQNTMSGYFETRGQRSVSTGEAEKILASYKVDRVRPSVREAAGKLPFCEGKFLQEPKLRYPKHASHRGMIGSVIIRHKVKDGNIVDATVLASVPFDGFRDQVVQTVQQWRYVPDEDPAEAGCSLDHNSVVREFKFLIQ